MPVPKVTFIGAGSAVFARQLMTDILAIDGLDEGVFALVDIDGSRLDLARRIADRLVELTDKRWKVEASTDRAEVLAGTDYVINSIEVAGLKNVRHDYDIPLRYGVDQCIGDTIGPGGIFKALRTGPAWLDIVADVARLAPNARILNYTNPMSILTLAAIRKVDLPVVGLCHSVQGTSRQLAGYLDIPYEEMDWDCAGINHNAWFTRLERRGEDLYPRLREKVHDPEIYEQDPVRFEVMLHLGAFVTESSGHFSEYVPYFRKRPDLVQRYARAGYLGESGFYANNWPRWRRENDESIEAMLRGEKEVPRQPPRRWMRGGRVRRGWERRRHEALRAAARAACGAQPCAHGGARAGRRGAAEARQVHGQVRPHARPADGRRLLAGGDRPPLRGDVGGGKGELAGLRLGHGSAEHAAQATCPDHRLRLGLGSVHRTRFSRKQDAGRR